MISVPFDSRCIKQIVSRFSGVTVWVIGDVILDTYVRGKVERISPEAPVPVVSVHERTAQLGGAANTAANCASLGARVFLWGVVGEDSAAESLQSLCAAAGVTGLLRPDRSRPTTAKTRVVAEGQQLLRLDHESTAALDPTTERALIEGFDAVEPPDFVIVSDYGKGCVTPSLWRALVSRQPRPPVLVDPRRGELSAYDGSAFLKPNLAEAAMVAGCKPSEVLAPGNLDRLRAAAGAATLVVTCGGEGIVVVAHGAAPCRVETERVDVFDVTGAGDTAGAAFSLSIAVGASPIEAAMVANAAAGITVRRMGAVAISQTELLGRAELQRAHSMDAKRMSLEAAEKWCAAARESGKRLVFTNGCFDLLHAGHVSLLKRARQLGDHLVVALNSDASVRRLKGSRRPVVRLEDRVAMLCALECVDAVVVFDADEPLECVVRLQPNVLVKGGDYRPEQVVGGDVVRSQGGKVVILAILEGRSTTSLVNSISHEG